MRGAGQGPGTEKGLPVNSTETGSAVTSVGDNVSVLAHSPRQMYRRSQRRDVQAILYYLCNLSVHLRIL